MRIRETHIWDHATLIIKDSGDEWMQQFLPWAGMLWGRTIYKKGNSYLLESSAAPIRKPVLSLSGFASADNGLISINALSDEAEIIEAENDSIIKLFKEGTLGRLLIGYGGRRDGENFYIHGLSREERVNSCGLDDDGFLISE